MKRFVEKFLPHDRRQITALTWIASGLNGIIALIYLFTAVKALYDYITIPMPEVVSYIGLLDGTEKLPPHIFSVVLGFVVGLIPAVMSYVCVTSALERSGRNIYPAAGSCPIISGALNLFSSAPTIIYFPSALCAAIGSVLTIAAGIAALRIRKNTLLMVIIFSMLAFVFYVISPMYIVCSAICTAILCVGAVAMVMKRCCAE